VQQSAGDGKEQHGFAADWNQGAVSGIFQAENNKNAPGFSSGTGLKSKKVKIFLKIIPKTVYSILKIKKVMLY
jgi:hypothetical protein